MVAVAVRFYFCSSHPSLPLNESGFFSLATFFIWYSSWVSLMEDTWQEVVLCHSKLSRCFQTLQEQRKSVLYFVYLRHPFRKYILIHTGPIKLLYKDDGDKLNPESAPYYKKKERQSTKQTFKIDKFPSFKTLVYFCFTTQGSSRGHKNLMVTSSFISSLWVAECEGIINQQTLHWQETLFPVPDLGWISTWCSCVFMFEIDFVPRRDCGLVEQLNASEYCSACFPMCVISRRWCGSLLFFFFSPQI